MNCRKKDANENNSARERAKGPRSHACPGRKERSIVLAGGTRRGVQVRRKQPFPVSENGGGRATHMLKRTKSFGLAVRMAFSAAGCAALLGNDWEIDGDAGSSDGASPGAGGS